MSLVLLFINYGCTHIIAENREVCKHCHNWVTRHLVLSSWVQKVVTEWNNKPEWFSFRALATSTLNRAATTPSRRSTSTRPLRWPAPSSRLRFTDQTRPSSTDTTTSTPTSLSAAAKTTLTATWCASSCRRRRWPPSTLVFVATPAVNFTERLNSRFSVPSVTRSWSRSRTRPPRGRRSPTEKQLKKCLRCRSTTRRQSWVVKPVA